MVRTRPPKPLFHVTAVLTLGALSCQVYDFEPVEPLAISQTTQVRVLQLEKKRPNLLLLVDTSGSMTQLTLCGGGSCPSRATAMKAAMDTFLSNSGTVARLGLGRFPSSGCNGAVLRDVIASDDNLQAHADIINADIQALSMGGNTPTAAALAMARALPQLAATDRDNFVLLLTDGLPNCNPNAPTSPCDACLCTGNCSSGTCRPLCEASCPTTSCLDRAGVIEQINQLARANIKTIVVGFGADLGGTGTAYETLQAMALAGGFYKRCPNGTDAECGVGGTCNRSTQICNVAFYHSDSATDLARDLEKIIGIINHEPCDYPLNAQPSDPRLLSVYVNGEPQPSGPDTWSYSGGKIIFTGGLCSRATQGGLTVEVRIVEKL